MLKWLRFGSTESTHEEEDDGRASLTDASDDGTACDCDWVSSNVYSCYDCAALAARGGHLEVLKWLLEPAQIFDWDDEWTCAKAAEGGQLEVLKWLRANGCQWDARTVEEATAAGHDDVLQWALANGCPS